MRSTKSGLGYTCCVRNKVSFETNVGLVDVVKGGSEWVERSLSERIEQVGGSATVWGWELSCGIGSGTDAVFESSL